MHFDTEEQPVIDVQISYDSKHILSMVKNNDGLFKVMIYDTTTLHLNQTICIEGIFISAIIIEQNEHGNKWVVAYNDDGNFHCIVFSMAGVILDLDISKLFKLEFQSLPLPGSFFPFSTCCFLGEDEIFYNFFNQKDKTHYHFIYNIKKMTLNQQLQHQFIEDCTIKNFPWKCFFDPKTSRVHCFYRQGTAFIISTENIS